jgi:hypothetical protein
MWVVLSHLFCLRFLVVIADVEYYFESLLHVLSLSFGLHAILCMRVEFVSKAITFREAFGDEKNVGRLTVEKWQGSLIPAFIPGCLGILVLKVGRLEV